MNDGWIKSEDELPPCDGTYEICQNPYSTHSPIGVAMYDGYGFHIENAYRDPKYWREIQFLKKKYGKQK